LHSLCQPKNSVFRAIFTPRAHDFPTATTTAAQTLRSSKRVAHRTPALLLRDGLGGRYSISLLRIRTSPCTCLGMSPMPNLTNLTPGQLRRAANIQERILELQAELREALSLPDAPYQALASPAGQAPKKHRISAAGIEAIRAAVKARWARERAKKKEAS